MPTMKGLDRLRCRLRRRSWLHGTSIVVSCASAGSSSCVGKWFTAAHPRPVQSVDGSATGVSVREPALRHGMALEEFPHHRTCLEVRDAVHRPASRSAVAVLGPTMAHSGDRAEHDFGALATTSVRHAPRRTHVVRLHGRRGAAVAHDPAIDVRLGARVRDGHVLGAVHVEERDRARDRTALRSAGNTGDRRENVGCLASRGTGTSSIRSRYRWHTRASGRCTRGSRRRRRQP